MMHAQPEPFLKVACEIKALYEEYFLTSQIVASRSHLAALLDRYADMADRGAIEVVTLRDDVRLVGCWVGVIANNHLAFGGKSAVTDMYLLTPEGMAHCGGRRLFRAVVEHLKAIEVRHLTAASNVRRGDERVFKALGFVPVETVHALDIA